MNYVVENSASKNVPYRPCQAQEFCLAGMTELADCSAVDSELPFGNCQPFNAFVLSLQAEL